ncbi:MAG: xanthine dehydrogenase family protein molybdopterin-binding subunit [Gammaproteobacteria bacterium]|nr:xanthine dehydrogenase family protein molybdopterin-binding subunit [Gammaproteobacteria bacterium]
MDVDGKKQQSSVLRVTRRRLLVGAAGAVAVAGGAGLWLTVGKRLTDQRFRNAVDRGDAFAPSVYLAVQPDGEVVIWLTRSEMGQGVATALPLIIAEELDADWSRVRVEQAVADSRYDYGPMATVASSSVSSQWIELRRAGAAARHMLMAAAARQWGVRAGECSTDNGRVVHVASDRVADYGSLADLAGQMRAPLRPRLKSPDEFRLLGTSPPRLEIPAKVSGRGVYGIDVRIKGMVHAAIARSPTLGGRAGRVDERESRAIIGVLDVVRISAGIAVVATDTWTALRGRDALQIAWQPGENTSVSDGDIADQLREQLASGRAGVARDDGDVLSMLASADKVHRAIYEVPYLAHAPLEPMNCAASVRDGRCEVWAPTQVPDNAREVAASVAQLPLERVTVHTTWLGGAFGRRATSDFVAEAVELAIAIGAPVQVVWSREDDTRHGLHRDAAAQQIEAVLDDNGRPMAWRHRVASASPDASAPGSVNGLALMGADSTPYALGAMRVEWVGLKAPVRRMIWRSVGHSYTAFAIESFIDELAYASGQDPLALRLKLLEGSPRLRHCVQRVGQLSGWDSGVATGAPPRWLGLAAVSCFGSHVAQVMALTESPQGGLRVEQIWCVADCGVLVHPDTVVAQLEGGIIFGLTAALHGRLRIRDGEIQGGNFDDYRLLQLADSPIITVDLIRNGEEPGGVGEVGVPPVAPALGNALFAATGERLRRLPLGASLA